MTEKSKLSSQELSKIKKMMLVRIILLLLSFALFVLLPAGTFIYWEFYAYLTILIGPMLFVLAYFFKHNPEFLILRMRMKEKEKQQVAVVTLSSIGFMLGFVISGLDHRFGWSQVPLMLVMIADLFVLLGYMLVVWVFKVNNYASRVIEINDNQKVISAGPYSIVRHPMYVGVLIMYMITPIALGSYWGVVPFCVIPVALIKRIQAEEKLLTEQLEGYKEYCEKVKFRLIPFIW